MNSKKIKGRCEILEKMIHAIKNIYLKSATKSYKEKDKALI
jgi:hypothetical protein